MREGNRERRVMGGGEEKKIEEIEEKPVNADQRAK